jgi:hypothetical protein
MSGRDIMAIIKGGILYIGNLVVEILELPLLFSVKKEIELADSDIESGFSYSGLYYIVFNYNNQLLTGILFQSARKLGTFLILVETEIQILLFNLKLEEFHGDT